MGFGIWWTNGYWLFGIASLKGQLMGSAYYKADDYCPHQLNKTPWGVAGPMGFVFCDHCYAICKYCIFIIKILRILLQKYSWGLLALLQFLHILLLDRHSSVAKVSQDYCETMRPRLVSRDCNTNARLSKI